MALTKSILESTKILEGLTDEQKLAIITLSNNDENAVIGSRFGEVYRQMDETILDATGIARDGAEKTYNYLGRAIKEYKGKYADYDSLKGRITELEEQVAKGGDQETVRAYKQAMADLEAVKKQYSDLKGEYDNAKVRFESDIFGMKVDGVLDSAKSALKFRSGVNEQMVALALREAVGKIKGYDPTFIDDGKGGKALVFRNADGTTMNNPENQLNPYTAGELLARELSSYDILDNGKRGGSGSKGGAPSPQQTVLSGVATRVQATRAIEANLSSRGLVRGTLQYQNEFDKMYAENNVNSLPIGSDE